MCILWYNRNSRGSLKHLHALPFFCRVTLCATTTLFQSKNIVTNALILFYVKKSKFLFVEATIWWKLVDITVPYLMHHIRTIRRAYVEEITSGQTVMSR